MPPKTKITQIPFPGIYKPSNATINRPFIPTTQLTPITNKKWNKSRLVGHENKPKCKNKNKKKLTTPVGE